MGEPADERFWADLVPLHVLGMDLVPVNGYVVRSRELIAAQLRAGARPQVVLPPSLPGGDDGSDDAWPFAGRLHRVAHPASPGGGRRGPTAFAIAALHGLRRLARRSGARTPATSDRRRRRSLGTRLARPLLELEDRLLMHLMARDLLTLAPRLAPHVVHAHSPYRSAQPALATARRLGLPAVYEVRGLWEESAVADGLWQRDSAPFRSWRRHEETAMRRADVVVTLGEALRREIVGRGVAADRVVVVPNAVGTQLAAIAADTERDAGGRDGPSCTFGYIGSLRPLEGVEHLLRGVAASRSRGRDARVLVVGDGPDRSRLERLAGELGLSEHATFTGRRPYGEIATLYREIDVFVVARPDQRVCRLVPPLKPLEAMAMGLPVVASELPALREMVLSGETGILVAPEHAEAFAAAVEPLYDARLRWRLGAQGRRWVLAHRTWPVVLPRLGEAYVKAGAGAADRGL